MPAERLDCQLVINQSGSKANIKKAEESVVTQTMIMTMKMLV